MLGAGAKINRLLDVEAGTNSVSFGAGSTVNQALIAAGTVDFSNVSVIAGGLQWSGGTIAGSGCTVVQGTLVLSGSVKYLRGQELVNAGAGTWTAGQVQFCNGATLDNASVQSLAIEGSGNCTPFCLKDSATTWTFVNEGTLIVDEIPSATVAVQTAYCQSLSGTTDVRSGEVLLARDSSFSGSILVHPGAKLHFGSGGNHDLSARSSLLVLAPTVVGMTPGCVVFDTGGNKAASIEGSYNAGNGQTVVNSGEVDFYASMPTTGDLIQNGGTLKLHAGVNLQVLDNFVQNWGTLTSCIADMGGGVQYGSITFDHVASLGGQLRIEQGHLLQAGEQYDIVRPGAVGANIARMWSSTAPAMSTPPLANGLRATVLYKDANIDGSTDTARLVIYQAGTPKPT